jgi:hypothetical protein
MLFQNFIGNASAPLVRRDCLEAVGGFDERLWDAGAVRCEDRKLFLDLAERYDFALVPEFLVGYRQYRAQGSWSYESMLRSHLLIVEDIRRRRPELPKRLFRWSVGRVEFYLGLRAVSLGDLRRGGALCLAALRHDPSLALSHWFRYSLGRIWRKAVPARPEVRLPFAEAPADLPTVPAGWAVQRQRDYAARIRIARRQGGGEGLAGADPKGVDHPAAASARVSGTR